MLFPPFLDPVARHVMSKQAHCARNIRNSRATITSFKEKCMHLHLHKLSVENRKYETFQNLKKLEVVVHTHLKKEEEKERNVCQMILSLSVLSHLKKIKHRLNCT